MAEPGGYYRSVLLDEANNVVSFALPKSVEYETFTEKYPDLNNGDFQLNDIIEGTMINLFHNGDFWEISTKGSVGGNYWYFRNSYDESDKKQKTFREIFRNKFPCIFFKNTSETKSFETFFVKNMFNNKCEKMIEQFFCENKFMFFFDCFSKMFK